jgi:hypothetical protein
MDNNGWGNYFENSTTEDCANNINPFTLHSFKPVPK